MDRSSYARGSAAVPGIDVPTALVTLEGDG
jgi:hypothetical protein